ncbi:MAG: hypothetical protein KF760_35175 [Candidatus Eremiobacteraeota bacterium]|nr:hypothetical protein [Candidatus Eremiobacteraeota bacterium]MCW5870214.1 hypothetical protein [Candidatus Eremiobacteraeota bacterium]
MQIDSSVSGSKQVLPKRPAAGRSEQVKKAAGNANRTYGFRNKAMDSVNLSRDLKDWGKVGPNLAQPVYGAPMPSEPRGGAQPVYGAPMPSSPGIAQPVYGAPMPSNPFDPKGSSPAQPVYGAPMPSNPFEPRGGAQPVYGAPFNPGPDFGAAFQ